VEQVVSSRQALDSKASGIMFGLCILWGLQQVVLKLAAPDISAVMQIALRSGLSALMVYPMIKLAKGTSLWGRDYLPAGILVGLLFAAEFFLVAQALRFTSAAHTVVLLYTAPIFVALGLHWKLPSERLSLIQWLGIACAFFGIVIAFLFRPAASQAAASSAIWGDALALLAGVLWAATTIAVRLTKLAEAPATQTLFYQLFIAFFVLLPVAFFYGTSDDSLVCIIPYKFTFPYRCRVICQLSDLVLVIKRVSGFAFGGVFLFNAIIWCVVWSNTTQ
jgi:drug/metabolite transporter (DMT)-like permease